MKRHYTDAEKRRGNVARGLIDLPPSGVMWGGRKRRRGSRGRKREESEKERGEEEGGEEEEERKRGREGERRIRGGRGRSRVRNKEEEKKVNVLIPKSRFLHALLPNSFR